MVLSRAEILGQTVMYNVWGKEGLDPGGISGGTKRRPLAGMKQNQTQGAQSALDAATGDVQGT